MNWVHTVQQFYHRSMQEEPRDSTMPQPELKKQQSVVFPIKGGGAKPSRMPRMCGEAAHPFIALFHIVFMIAVVFFYLALPIVFKPMTAYILIIVAGAIDFYFVKNISGRLLVGLKWWFEITEDGQQITKFESKMDERDIPTGNQRIFWDPFYLFLIAWFVLAVLSIISFSAPHLFICIFNFGLLKYNFNYFRKCWEKRGDHVERLFHQHGHEKMAQYYRGSLVGQMEYPKQTEEVKQ